MFKALLVFLLLIFTSPFSLADLNWEEMERAIEKAHEYEAATRQIIQRIYSLREVHISEKGLISALNEIPWFDEAAVEKLMPSLTNLLAKSEPKKSLLRNIEGVATDNLQYLRVGTKKFPLEKFTNLKSIFVASRRSLPRIYRRLLKM